MPETTSTPTETSSSTPSTITPLEAPRYSNGRQSSQMTQLLRTSSGVKLRLDIECDSVAYQSSGLASAFDPVKLKWNVVASIPYRELAVVRAGFNPYRPADAWAQAAFFKDSAELLRQLELLFG